MSEHHVHKIYVNIILVFILSLTYGCGSSGPAITENNDHDNSPTYSVGGTIKGLIGNGLVLQNNGVDKLVIEENGTFKFPTQIADGNQCNVMILLQPTDPQQLCQVANGDQMIKGSNISNIEVECICGLSENFSGEINAKYWKSSAEYRRELVDGALQYALTTKSNYALNYISFKDKNCGSVSMDTAITDTFLKGTGHVEYAARLESCGYHSATPGERVGKKTGDVLAAIELKGSHAPFQAYYYVFKCIEDNCSDWDSVELLSPNAAGSNLLGQVALGERARLLIDWDRFSPGQFSFQLNNNSVVTFDPVAAGAPIDAVEANAPEKYFGVKTVLSNPNDTGYMTATFDNVMVNERRYDDFENMTFPSGSLWSQTYGTIGVDNGRLLMETAKECTGDLSADNKEHSTSLYSNTNLVPNQDIAAVDISMDPASFIIDNGGSSAEGDAVLEMTFHPPDVKEMGWTNTFLVQAGLREDSSGVRAVVWAIGCADSSCRERYIDETQIFSAVVENNSIHHFSIEKTSNNSINISIDNSESIVLDLSGYNKFINTAFKSIGLKTLTRGTDRFRDEAFVRAHFDNVLVGSPN